ncbi:hypothetical protein ACH4E7_44800 [Kitasatospora sp. NPDC018058]|uniref:hypothetical protein n=1 Tax=Kitasatospora sp. NPDC018058 TaxID=3364025 RepID=UPI0037BF61D9
MGDGYGADPEALKQVAAGLNGVIAELKAIGVAEYAETGRGFSQLGVTGMEAGSSELAAQFKEFCDRWEWGVRSLVAKGNDMAGKLDLAAGWYHDQEQYASGLSKDVFATVFGNPHQSDEQIEGKSWSQVLGDNPINDIMHPDFSGKSFDKAGSDIKHQWSDLGQDLTQGPGVVTGRIDPPKEK